MKKLAAVALAFLSLARCEEAPLTAPNGSEIFLQANPPFVIANGGISVVTAVVTEPAGTLVPDGTEVLFFTTWGGSTRSARRHGVSPTSTSQSSRVRRRTSQRSRAVSGSQLCRSRSAARCRTVQVTADPQLITGSRQSRITATVFDEFGNPVQNVPVSFSLTPDPLLSLEERLESGGALLYTNSNGQVFDVLRTLAPIGLGQKTVTVTATAASAVVLGVTDSVTVFID
jgi:hypothetical protein